MKITKITLQSFRAFDEPFELDLGSGKSLLLFGENGSGKSSIYLALKRFFEERGDDISNYRNHFSPPTRDSRVLIDFKWKGVGGRDVEKQVPWDATEGHPLPVPAATAAATLSADLRSLLVDGAHRGGFLDYRAMLRTHLLSGPLPRGSRGAAAVHSIIYGATTEGFEDQLFDLVSLVILAGCPVTIPGGTVAKIGELMRTVWKNPPASWHKGPLALANGHANSFSAAFNGKLQELETKLGEFLNYFGNHGLTCRFVPVSLSWDKNQRKLDGANLKLDIQFRGQPISNHHQFLNEARLSALAICLFLAGVALADNDYSNPAHPRFLVLDDALIGLDIQNRLPVIEILKSASFRNHQIFLLTHDRLWFDLARAHLPEKYGWYHRELQADESTGSLLPKLKVSKSDLASARGHLANGDLKAAAVYARSAFEWKIREVCEEFRIKVAYKLEASKIDANSLWTGILERQRQAAAKKSTDPTSPDFVPQSLIDAVDVIRSNVLNRLSHTGSSSLVEREVETAIDTLELLLAHEFGK